LPRAGWRREVLSQDIPLSQYKAPTLIKRREERRRREGKERSFFIPKRSCREGESE